MADVTKEFSKLGIMKETTEGTYQAPAGDTDFIETLEDGATIEGTREKKDRNTLSGDRIKRNFRLSKKDVSASVPVECKASDVIGAKPKYAELFEAAGFGVSSLGARITSGVGNTTSQINIADTSSLSVGDIVLVKESELSANKDHVSPIASIDPNVSITLLVPADNAFTDNVELEKSTHLKLDKTVNETLSITKIYEGDETEMRAVGCRTSNISLNNFVTGEYPSWAFDLVGLNFEDILNSTAFNPSYEDSAPPLVLGACVHKGATKLELNEFSLAIQNNVSIKMSTCAENGNVSSRGTGKYVVSGSMNPFKKSDAIDFKLDESEFSLFGYAYNPSANDGEKTEVFAFYIPKCRLVTKTDGDAEGIMVDSLGWEATPDSEADSIRIAFF